MSRTPGMKMTITASLYFDIKMIALSLHLYIILINFKQNQNVRIHLYFFYFIHELDEKDACYQNNYFTLLFKTKI